MGNLLFKLATSIFSVSLKLARRAEVQAFESFAVLENRINAMRKKQELHTDLQNKAQKFRSKLEDILNG
jgi:hypothetical protein